MSPFAAPAFSRWFTALARLFALGAAVASVHAASGPGAGPAIIWNPATEFSTTGTNPNGVWSYGWMDTGFTTFTPYVNRHAASTDYRNWYGWGGDETPAVGYNGRTTALNGVPAGYLLLHPGPGSEPSVLRWTAPLGATLRVAGLFSPGDSGSMQVAVRKNSTVLWSATDSGTFDLNVTVVSGDTVDFTVYGGYGFGSTGLQVTLGVATLSLPLTTGDSNKIALTSLAGGTAVQFAVTGSGDLANANLQTNPDGSLAATAGTPWTAANAGAPYPAVSGFPAGDGVNHFVGGGLNYDHGGGGGWTFAGKQTTDTTDAAAIRAGAVVGTFVASPTRADWFLIGSGRTISVPTGGATLYLAVNEVNNSDNHGSYTVTATAAAPTNDAFASAATIAGTSFSFSASNVLATKESGEPSHAANVGGASVWWKWTAPKTGIVNLSTIGSSFDTLLGVYTGTAVNALTTVASDDNSGPAGTSKLTFNATAGTVYLLAVDGAAGATGNLVVNVAYGYFATALAGSVGSAGTTDATGNAARFNTPTGVAADGSGNVYVADYLNATVRKITPARVVTTLTGTAGTTGNADGTGPAALFNRPFGLAVDSGGNIFVSDYSANHTIRKITPGGVVSTYAGTAGAAGSADGTGGAARFTNPADVALDAAGNLYVADRGNHLVRKISSGGVVTTLAGSAGVSGNVDGLGTAARFNRPQGIAVDLSGNVFVSDSENHTIRKITPAGLVSTLAGSVATAGNVDGLGGAARFRFPYSVAVEGSGTVFVDDYGNGSIRKIAPSGVVTTIATGFNLAQGMALDPAGSVLVADSDNHVVWKLLPSFAPEVASLSPAAVVPGGSVTITGLNFTGATGVSFNGVAAASFTVVSATTITATTPTVLTAGPVTVTGPGGTSTTTASFTVSPIFVTQPIAVASAAVGGSLTLTVNVAAPTGVTYQWRKFGQPIAGATAASLALTNLALFDAGLYDVVVTSGGIGFPSAASRVSVNPPVTSANLLTASATFAPRVESEFAAFRTVQRGTDGKIYLAGYFGSLFGSARAGLARLNSDGTLDTAFAPVVAINTEPLDRIYAFAVQADGKVLVGGSFESIGGFPRRNLARLNADGSFDRSFSPKLGLDLKDVYALLIQPDGKIVVGTALNYMSSNLVRLESDGALDPTFVSGTGFNSAVRALARQTDGALLVGGSFTGYNTATIGRLVRLSSTGALDTAFATAGGAGFDNTVNSLVLQSDGKLLVGGEFVTYGITTQKYLARLTTTGALDGGFATGTGFDGSVTQLELQSDGAILAVGHFYRVNDVVTDGIVRLLGTGARDATFVTGSDSHAGFNQGANGLALLSTGSVLVAANDSTRYNSTTDNTGPLLRLSTLGALDTAYAPTPRSPGLVKAIVPAPSGQWVIGGNFTHVNGVARSNLARLNADGSLDSAFAPTGLGLTGTVSTVLVQPDGKIIAGGTFTAYDRTPAGRLARLTTTGALDGTFNTGTGFDSDVHTLALQADGKLLIGGSFANYNSSLRRALVRLTPTGGVDPGFAVTGAGFADLSSVRVLVIQPDARICVGGEFYSYNGTSANRLLRLNPDGGVDSAFTLGSGFTNTVLALLLQPDGKLVVGGGFDTFDSTSTGRIARLNPNGTVDSAFAAFPVNNTVTALLLLSDGRLVAGGEFDTYGSAPGVGLPHVARLNPDGTLDSSFRVPGFASSPQVLQLTPSGQILLGGDKLGFPDRVGSGLALLETAPAPVIGTQPAQQVANVGGTATFSVTATGTNLLYQWRRDGTPIPGATAASFTITGATLFDSAAYSVVVGNVFGSVTSTPALLTGSGPAPTITALTSAPVVTGATAQLAVTATGATAYQWRKLGVPITGNTSATTATLSLASADLADAALYDVFVYNGLSLTRSASVRLSVTSGGAVSSPIRLDRSFPSLFESQAGGGLPSRIFALPDGKYYISGNFVSIDGAPRLGLARFLADGTLDTTFNTEVGGGEINAFARQSDGKLIIAGDFHSVNGVECNHLARLNVDGSLDTAFCSGHGSGTQDSIYAVALQADGKILLGGYLSSVGDVPAGHKLARLNSDGTVDTAFATALAIGFNDVVRTVAVHTDGRIYVGGEFTSFNAVAANRLVVLESTGARATTFTGLTTGFDKPVNSLLVLADGKVVAAGQFSTYNGTAAVRLVRLLADGARDTAYATGAGANGEITRLALLADGRLLAIGSFSRFDGAPSLCFVRLTTAGLRDATLDTSVGFDYTPADLAVLAGGDVAYVGAFQTAIGAYRLNFARFSAETLTSSQIGRWGTFDGHVGVLVPAPGGKWLAAGSFSRVGSTMVHSLVRFNADGTVDSTFSTARGIMWGDIKALAVQGDGKILVGGDFYEFGDHSGYAHVGFLFRLNADGTRDLGFFPGTGFDDGVAALAVQSDGRILVGGYFQNLDGRSARGLVRLNADGTRDDTLVLGTGFDDAVQALALYPDGRIAVGGSFQAYNGLTSLGRLTVLNPDGTRDSTTAAGLRSGFDNGEVHALLFQPDGKLLVGGTFTSLNDSNAYSLVRLNADCSRDPGFGIGARFTVSEGTADVAALVLQSDGKILAGGNFSAFGGFDFTSQLVRLTAGGALDTTFQSNYYGSVSALAVRADGRVLVGGSDLSIDEAKRQGILVLTGATGILPTITVQPVAQSTVYGGSVTFTVTATGTPAPTYQWQRGSTVLSSPTATTFTNIPGATAASYTLTSATQAHAGLYRVIVTNTAGSFPSDAVPLAVVTRNLINFYARAVVAPAGSMASSFTVEGTQPKTVLLIGVGGTRAASVRPTSGGGSTEIGSSAGSVVTYTGLADPRLTLTDSSGTVVATNDNWPAAANATAISTTAAQVAATPGLTTTGEGAADAAILITLAPGTYHASLDDSAAGGGVALLQIYDADTDGRPRLVMFTLRAKAAAGDGAAVAGFTVDGTLAKSFLFRALGQSLGESNGVLADPVLSLYRGTSLVVENDDTHTASPSIPIVGARPILDTLDSMIDRTVTPGVYVLQVVPYGGGAPGTVLLELFEVDDQRPATLPPVLTYLSPNQRVVAGDAVEFGVVAVAKPAATYQWRKNTAPITGATDAILRRTNVQASDVDNYDVIITAGAATRTSPARTLTLLPEFHSADSNRDRRISLVELTRVIQLYGYQTGSTRTGEYHTQATGTEDGFSLGPGTIATHHSADTNRNGRIDPGELFRVIELYNYVNGTERTGEYRPDGETEDGFAAGPRVTSRD